MSGGGGNCAKYLSDNFDGLSTISKAVDADQQPYQDSETITYSIEDDDDNAMQASSYSIDACRHSRVHFDSRLGEAHV